MTVGFGTGFLHRRLGKWFVITNWHVATARDPENPGALLEGYKSSPNAYSLHLAVKADPNRFVPTVPFALYQNGAPNWLETTINGVNGRVDLVALPVELPVGADAPLVVPIEEFSPEPRDFLFAGREVVVVGYPFGIGAANPHAIWKRAFVASEPSMLIAGMPKYYIDGPGRPGMSGSPVFILSRGMQVTADTHALLTNVESGGALAALAQISSAELLSAPDALIPRFAGVYSGSVGNQSLDQLRVGIAWHASLVDRLFTHPVPGSNLSGALDFLNRVTAHRAITVVISDFLECGDWSPPFPLRDLSRSAARHVATAEGGDKSPHSKLSTALRQANRRHDVVAVQIIDPHELELPALGRLILQDAETGDVVEVNTSAATRRAFAEQQKTQQGELERLLRGARIDAIRLRTNESYAGALGRFFETREKRRRHG